jgi:chromosome segregation ATPase
MQLLFDEKEALKKNNEKLLAHLNNAESKYENLSESIHLFEFENKDFTLEDVLALKSNISVLEGEIKKYQHDINSLGNRIEQLEDANQELNRKLEVSNQETENYRQMVIAEKLETKKPRDIVLDTYSQLET